MPFKSEAQRKYMWAAANRGEIKMKTVKEWEDHTPKGKKLPEHAASHNKTAFDDVIEKARTDARTIYKR